MRNKSIDDVKNDKALLVVNTDLSKNEGCLCAIEVFGTLSV